MNASHLLQIDCGMSVELTKLVLVGWPLLSILYKIRLMTPLHKFYIKYKITNLFNF